MNSKGSHHNFTKFFQVELVKMGGGGYSPSRHTLLFNQESEEGVGGLSYLDEFKLTKHCEIVMRSLRPT